MQALGSRLLNQSVASSLPPLLAICSGMTSGGVLIHPFFALSLQNSAEPMRLGLLTCVFETVPSMWRISYVFEMISPGDLCHVPSIFLIFDFLHSGRQFMLAGKCGAMSVLCNLARFRVLARCLSMKVRFCKITPIQHTRAV